MYALTLGDRGPAAWMRSVGKNVSVVWDFCPVHTSRYVLMCAASGQAGRAANRSLGRRKFAIPASGLGARQLLSVSADIGSR